MGAFAHESGQQLNDTIRSTQPNELFTVLPDFDWLFTCPGETYLTSNACPRENISEEPDRAGSIFCFVFFWFGFGCISHNMSIAGKAP